MIEQKMKSIWSNGKPQLGSEVSPDEGFFESNIVRYELPTKPDHRFILEYESTPFDDEKDDFAEDQLRVMQLIAEDARVLLPIREEYVLAQTIKNIEVYDDIVRLDILTTVALLRVECSSFRFSRVE